MNAFMESKEADERQISEVVVQCEYENMLSALRYAVSEKVALYSIYDVLDTYLNRKKEYQRGEEIDALVLRRFEGLGEEEIVGAVGEEYIKVLIVAANRQLNSKHYVGVKEAYQKIIQSLEGELFEERERRILQGRMYHNLGMVPFEERKWEEARRNYEEALGIYQEYKDRYEQAGVYHQLGRVAEEERKWEEASGDFVLAWQIFAEFKDAYYSDMAMRSLKRLWGECEDDRVRERITEGVGVTVEELEKVFGEDEEV